MLNQRPPHSLYILAFLAALAALFLSLLALRAASVRTASEASQQTPPGWFSAVCAPGAKVWVQRTYGAKGQPRGVLVQVATAPPAWGLGANGGLGPPHDLCRVSQGSPATN